MGTTGWDFKGGAVTQHNAVFTTGASDLGTVPCPLPRWYAVHTRVRHEKKIANDLARYGITAFVPTMSEVHRWSDRRKIVEVPLFSCYVFVNSPGWRQVHPLVVRTPGFLQWVGANGEPTAIPDAQIEAVRSPLANGFPACSYPFLKLGQRVRVRGGCLDGIEGILVKNNGDSRLVVSIDLIQQSISVALQGYDVEPV